MYCNISNHKISQNHISSDMASGESVTPLHTFRSNFNKQICSMLMKGWCKQGCPRCQCCVTCSFRTCSVGASLFCSFEARPRPRVKHWRRGVGGGRGRKEGRKGMLFSQQPAWTSIIHTTSIWAHLWQPRVLAVLFFYIYFIGAEVRRWTS